ncbi:MAG: hypothetical protein ABIH99_05835 [Candidatus Micrarchaeota archaeon]
MHNEAILLTFGSTNVQGDELAWEIGGGLKLKGIRCIKCEKPEDILETAEENKGKEIFVMDVVKELGRVRFVGVDELSEHTIVSLHDFDVGFFLKLLKEVGISIKIIGVPFGMKKEDGLKEVSVFLADYLAGVQRGKKKAKV